MIPSEMVPLSAIPLTPHGKIDRNRLPLPLSGKPILQQQALASPEEERVAKIWADLLGTSEAGANDNFFDLGGHSVLVAVLQQRIKSEFGQLIPFAELLHYPTIRQQAQLTRRSHERQSALPPGVFGPEPNGSNNGLFWMNPLGPQFVKGFGAEKPLFSVTLTPEDVASFSEHPSLEELAAIHVSKLLATQPRGPYMVGGFCAGSILAYEIASQLTGQGQDVSLLVMVDAPIPTYLTQRRRTLADRLSQLRYWFQRSYRLGPQRTYRYFVERVRKRFPRVTLTGGPETDLKVAQKIIETAAFAYRPRVYDGNVLLLLAGDRPAHIDFVPGWQAVITRELNVQVVNTHHRDMLIGDTAWNVARTIGLHLTQLPAHS
jgi:thioesterase domain-containing protein/acyl carrier protein